MSVRPSVRPSVTFKLDEFQSSVYLHIIQDTFWGDFVCLGEKKILTPPSGGPPGAIFIDFGVFCRTTSGHAQDCTAGPIFSILVFSCSPGKFLGGVFSFFQNFHFSAQGRGSKMAKITKMQIFESEMEV